MAELVAEVKAEEVAETVAEVKVEEVAEEVEEEVIVVQQEVERESKMRIHTVRSFKIH